jgi:hypothetical protein
VNAPVRLHALCAPSSADRWMVCTGSVAMEADEPDTTSDAAEEGTRAHDLAAQWLTGKQAPAELLSDVDMHAALRIYVEFVFQQAQAARGAGAQVDILVEQKLPLQDVTGERGATGTADCVLLMRYPTHAEMHVIDLKYGRGVEVDDETRQLPIYALAALAKYGLMDDFSTVHTTIVQPRLRTEPTTVTRTIPELEAFGQEVMARAQEALAILADGPATAIGHLQVSEKGCRFCKAQHKCPAKVKQVHDTVYGEMQDLTQEGITPIDEVSFVGSPKDFAALLPVFMRRVPEIEAWCKYVRAKVEQLLVNGEAVDGFKLVEGRAGARQWLSQDAVLPVLMSGHVPRELVMTLPELRSPADIEKRIKKDYSTIWEQLQVLITQAPGKASVVPVSDPRPAYASSRFDGESYDARDLL